MTKPQVCCIGAGSKKAENRCGRPAAFAISFNAAPHGGEVLVCVMHRHALLTEGYCRVRPIIENLEAVAGALRDQ